MAILRFTAALDIDFDLLRAQKLILLQLVESKYLAKHEVFAIDGIINLLDAIQDEASEEYPERDNEIYLLNDDDEPVLSIDEAIAIVTSRSTD
jgi:hypothetical protein